MTIPSPRARRLHALFLGLAGAAACGKEDTLTADDFATDACRGGELQGVTPAVPVDYLEVRSQTEDFGSEATEPPEVVERHGTRCATAKDKAKCETILANLRPSDIVLRSRQFDMEARYLVFTRGDDVGSVTTVEALRGFLAPFENEKDGALLLREFSDHRLQCEASNARPSGDGFEFLTNTGYACGAGTRLDANNVKIARDGSLTVVETQLKEEGDPKCAIGRRPQGYTSSPAGRSIAEYLASAAELEAASVPAFRRLARELRAHGAPRELVDRALRAAGDEVRHTRAMRSLAARFGAEAKRPRVGKLPVRPLVEIAEENAREGCVRETFGALVATIQSLRATDASIRAEMKTIATDETEHAALAWDVAAWLDSMLDDEARAKVEQAHAAAVAELDASLESSFTSPLLGLPSPQEARALLARLEPELSLIAA